MQNRYTGDIGDFGKLGLLRQLSRTGLSIGVNWYLIPNETHNGDGRHIGYLKNDAFRACDEQLWSVLGQIVGSGKRQVSAFPNAETLVLKFKTTSQRYYFFLVQPSHAEAMVRCIEQMISTPWKNHFEIL